METRVFVQTLETPTEALDRSGNNLHLGARPHPTWPANFAKTSLHQLPPRRRQPLRSVRHPLHSSRPFASRPRRPPSMPRRSSPPVDAGLQQQHKRRRSPSAAPPSEALQRRRPPIPLQRRCHGPGVRHGGRGRPRGHGPGAPRP